MEKIKTLIVEDQQDDIELLLLELDRDGLEYEWSSVDNKEAFLDQLTPEIDIILADYYLPQFSAPEALELLQATGIDAPFIVVTGSISEEAAVACMKNGAADYLLKDRLTRLGGAIRQALEKRDLARVQKDAEILRIELEKERELRELKSRFISMIVHDFRNPLSVIQLTTDMLRKFNCKMDEQTMSEKYDVILERASHLSSLIDDVLLIGTLEAKKKIFSPTKGDLAQFSRAFFNEFVKRVDNDQYKPQFEIHGQARELTFDHALMERALYNLLSNAVKYSPDGGKIEMGLSFEANKATITVSDDGIGISSKDQKFLFESFHRAANVGDISGSGLGLAIVKQVADIHGGHVACSSEEDRGTTFILDLPYIPAKSRA